MHDLGDYSAEHTLRVAVDKKPEAWLLKKRTHSYLRAEICADCGFVQVYATDPAALWDAYQTSLSNVE